VKYRRLLCVMLNPSTADADVDDPTIARLIGFVSAWNGLALGKDWIGAATLSACERYRYVLSRTWDSLFGSVDLEVANLYAFRATDPRVMLAAEDPVGPDNDAFISDAVARADIVIAAWGATPGIDARARHVTSLITSQKDLHALRLTAEGRPSHPLYLPGNLTPAPYRSRLAA
jgi:hypothetical protein